MKEIFDTIWNDPFCRTYAPYIIIACTWDSVTI